MAILREWVAGVCHQPAVRARPARAAGVSLLFEAAIRMMQG
ncbi:MAG TPA: hypothetical protein VGJ18_05770 [Gemmatimonadaceae bacterium]